MTKIALLDSDIIAYRAAVLTEDVTEAMAVELADRITDTWVDGAGCDGYVACLSIGSSFRRNAWPLYKSNRKDKVRPQHLSAVMNHLKAGNACWHPGLEADDVMGILATHPDSLDELCIVTIDKDLDQVPGLHHNPDKETRYTVSPDDGHLYKWRQVLSGDPTDFYPGIPGIGVKKAAAILDEVCEGDREDVVKEMYNTKELEPAYYQQMVVCATILTYKETITCDLLSLGLTEAGTLLAFLESIKSYAGQKKADTSV